MKDIVKSVHITLKVEEELNETEQKLIAAAKEATFRSYAPYSQFHVGASVLLANGEIITGNNQENCAFPSGLCAERTTLFYANSRYPDIPVKILCIAARDTSGEFTKDPISPCGGCRQVMLETEHRFGIPMQVMLYGTDGTYFIACARDLLPVAFDSESL
jgi:cytidine deaminase